MFKYEWLSIESFWCQVAYDISCIVFCIGDIYMYSAVILLNRNANVIPWSITNLVFFVMPKA